MVNLRFLLTASCLVTLLQPTVAYAQRSQWGGSCNDYISYIITTEGRCIDLSYITLGMQQARQQEQQAQERLVDIILYGSVEESEPYKTGFFLDRGKGTVVYADRYLKQIYQYPETVNPENEFETLLVDCKKRQIWSTAITFSGEFDILYQTASEASEKANLLTDETCRVAGIR